ncbi:hypothetical protein V5799_011535 [Amblyomma americanum]|uniref:Uncharacterized protein n=1 Tax=Amblyomma americanum TaxID=6943 RepID=A0AAQ4EHL0_AMBAM
MRAHVYSVSKRWYNADNASDDVSEEYKPRRPQSRLRSARRKHQAARDANPAEGKSGERMLSRLAARRRRKRPWCHLAKRRRTASAVRPWSKRRRPAPTCHRSKTRMETEDSAGGASKRKTSPPVCFGRTQRKATGIG